MTIPRALLVLLSRLTRLARSSAVMSRYESYLRPLLVLARLSSPPLSRIWSRQRIIGPSDRLGYAAVTGSISFQFGRSGPVKSRAAITPFVRLTRVRDRGAAGSDDERAARNYGPPPSIPSSKGLGGDSALVGHSWRHSIEWDH
jgi:hypothetical protein